MDVPRLSEFTFEHISLLFELTNYRKVTKGRVINKLIRFDQTDRKPSGKLIGILLTWCIISFSLQKMCQ